MQSYLQATYNEIDESSKEIQRFDIIPHLLRMLHAANIEVNQYDIDVLSHKRLAIFVVFAERLFAFHRLQTNTYHQLLDRVNIKKPKVVVNKIIKNKCDNRELFSSENGIMFYQDHHALRDTNLEGGDGKVVAGFANYHDTKPLYAIKWMHRHRTLEAAKEVRYQHFLNRKPAHLLLYKDSFAVIMEWRDGVKLADILEHQYRAIPILRRIHCFISLLIELNQLHAALRIHCDLFDVNVLIDFNTDTMSLVDFSNCYRPAPKFFTKYESHSLTAILKIIFPDAGDKASLLHNAMQHMIHLTDQPEPPSSLQLLRFCRGLAEKHLQLDETILQTLIEKNFTLPHLTIEDLLRGTI